MSAASRPPVLLAPADSRVERGAADPGAILSCRLRVTFPRPEWLRELSVAHPDLDVEVVDRLEVGRQRTIFEVRLVGDAETDRTGELDGLSGVREVERIETADGSATYRVLFSGPTYLPLVKRLRLLRRFPFPVRAGVATWTVVGPAPKVRALFENLSASRVPFEVESVGRGTTSPKSAALTPRQREILDRAVAEGYFEVPRRITLTKLAPRIGVAPSTLSVTLAVIERKIIASRRLDAA